MMFPSFLLPFCREGGRAAGAVAHCLPALMKGSGARRGAGSGHRALAGEDK